MKILERERAVGLRKEGLTYGEIGKLLDVSKGALSLWLRDISYLPNEASQQRRRLASIKAGQVLHRRKMERVLKIKEAAKQEIQKIDTGMFKLLGVIAYWAEGSKTKDGLIKFTNTDPRFIQFAIKWLREICKVPEEKLRLHIRIHSDINRKKSENYWSSITGIPRNRCYKTTLKNSDSNGKRFRKLSNGVASIIVCDSNLFHKIMGWIEALIDKTDL
jgi:hypothetical protein